MMVLQRHLSGRPLKIKLKTYWRLMTLHVCNYQRPSCAEQSSIVCLLSVCLSVRAKPIKNNLSEIDVTCYAYVLR